MPRLHHLTKTPLFLISFGLLAVLAAIPAAMAQSDAVGPTVLDGDGPKGRIISFILQGEPRSPNEEQLREAIDGVVADVFGETSEFNPEADEALATEAVQIMTRTRESFPLAEGASPLLFRVFDVPVLVVPVAVPLPRDEFVTDWQDRRQFPNASAVLNEHRAHTIIFALVDPTETAQQVRAAEAVSAVAAGYATSDNTLGVHWGESDMALPPVALVEAFEQAATEAAEAEAEEAPVKPAWHRLLTLWINIRPANAEAFRTAYAAQETSPIEAELPGDAIGFATQGLAAFIGREIEMLPSGRPAPEQALVLVNLLAYLLDRGQVFKDDDTLGFTEERTIATNIVDQGGLPGMTETPILRLTYIVDEDAEAGISDGSAEAGN